MAEREPTAHEESPLLAHPRHDERESERPVLRGRRVTVLLASQIFLVVLGMAMVSLPTLRILEDFICRRSMLGITDEVDEKMCKDLDDVQGELAYVIALHSMFEVVPGLILGFPYGLLADRIGRRPVLGLSVLGMACSVFWAMLVLHNMPALDNPRLVWTAQAWLLIGGGKHVLIAMAYSIVADVEPPEKLSDGFFIIIVSSLFANLAGTFLTAELMRIDPWIPLLLGAAILVPGGLSILFLPETLHTRPKPAADSQQAPEDASFAAAIKARASSLLSDLRQSASLLKSAPVLALLPTFLTSGIHSRALEFSAQYISKSLGWTLADAGVLLSGQVVLNIALYVFIIPSLSRLLTSPRMPFRLAAPIKDLVLARASGVAVAVGALLLGLPSAPAAVAGLMIFTLGLGAATLCRVVVSALVESSQTARMYTLISVLAGLGELGSGPVIAWLFKVGMRMGDDMAGLPYFGVAAACGVAAVGVFFVRSSALVKRDGVEGV